MQGLRQRRGKSVSRRSVFSVTRAVTAVKNTSAVMDSSDTQKEKYSYHWWWLGKNLFGYIIPGSGIILSLLFFAFLSEINCFY